ncbi:GIY-YIG nuclease family protein [Halobellus captivus]|uniref:GIY-YIG nuclease family protein n=1 Tax=Halobellus captivus TaxID=2592614 RepID=UPI00119E1CAD|nr:GIY-YIG nuclease family protein [Halobellus captivus]
MSEEGDDAADARRPVVVDPDAIAVGTDALGIGRGTAPPGSYVLLFSLETSLTTTIGALGAVTFDSPAYAYVGSAFGSNGLGRIDRHRRVAAGEHDVRHWHIDYFGGHPDVTLDAVVAAPHADIECRVAAGLRERVGSSPEGVPVPCDGVGASDCGCGSHLFAFSGSDSPRATVVGTVDELVRK